MLGIGYVNKVVIIARHIFVVLFVFFQFSFFIRKLPIYLE